MARRKRKATTRKKSTTIKTTKKENIRLTKKWKELYKDNKIFKGELMTVEQYKQLIDELYTGERVDNKDLMGSFAKFKNKKQQKRSTMKNGVSFLLQN